MVMNFVSYKSCILSVCLMCFQMLFVCKNHFPQFTLFLLGPFKSVKEGFYCDQTVKSKQMFLIINHNLTHARLDNNITAIPEQLMLED
jgi:hypothetical protein